LRALKLTRWELGNLHLPPVTTVTLYEGSAPVEYLRLRIAGMLEKNPWLTSRIIKKSTADGVVAMTYATNFDTKKAAEEIFSVCAPGEVALSLDMPYEELVRCLLPLQCARSKPATDNNEALFKVAVVPIEAGAGNDKQSMPLQRVIALPGFALLVSMNHTLGDGHTYYKLYNMLSMDAELEALDPVRVAGFEEAKTEVIGKKESALFASAGVAFGILGTYLGTKFGKRGPQNVCVNEVDSVWVEEEKARKASDVPFVSSNDVLTSWFFRQMKSDVNIMVANFRSRRPSVLNLTDTHAGNYEANIPYFPGDVETPSLVRQSIRGTDGTFRAVRAGSPQTEIPGATKLLRNKTSIITNWATFYSDVNLQYDGQDGGSGTLRPKLHFPIMESDGIITSVWNNAIVFRPRAGSLGVLMITREKEQGGPLGKRIL